MATVIMAVAAPAAARLDHKQCRKTITDMAVPNQLGVLRTLSARTRMDTITEKICTVEQPQVLNLSRSVRNTTEITELLVARLVHNRNLL